MARPTTSEPTEDPAFLETQAPPEPPAPDRVDGDRGEDLGFLETQAPSEDLPLFETQPPAADLALLETQAPPDADPLGGDVGSLPTRAATAPAVTRNAQTLASLDPTRNKRFATHTADPAQPDQMLGRYRILGKLGAGGMGVVFLADDPQLRRKVAVKLLHHPDRALTERLVREARSMAKVSHPNVVGVYDVGVASGGATYIAMELVNGTSLREWQTTPRAIAEVVQTYVAAGHGLAAAHAAGIVHRDFKPDNVLVGDDGRVRVTDFGLAAAGSPNSAAALATSSADALATVRDASEPDGSGTLTIAGSVLGTPAYMAPEQFEGGNVDPRTDQFNFCVALYEALYGERPFSGRTYRELGDAVCAGTVRPARSKSRVSRALRQIVLRGLSVRPGDRFASIDHLLAQLGRDRAKPWRRAAIVATAIAAVLGLGLVADWIVRDRAITTTRIAFANTGKQFDRAVHLLDESVDAMSNRALVEPAFRQVSGNYDETDFGLGTDEGDDAKRTSLHELLVSASVTAYGKTKGGVLAIADKKGRLLYTAASPSAWSGDLLPLPSVKRALDNIEQHSLTIVRDDDPTVVATKLLSPQPVHGPWLLFTRALVFGGSVGALYLQLVDGNKVLDDVRLDDDTLLALVAPDGSAVGDVPAELREIARSSGDISEIQRGGTTYQVQTRPLHDLDGTTVIAHFVMARPLPGVLSLFPGARTVFALATLLALLAAAGTAFRARQITGARV